MILLKIKRKRRLSFFSKKYRSQRVRVTEAGFVTIVENERTRYADEYNLSKKLEKVQPKKFK